MLGWASRQHWVQHEVWPWPTCLTTLLSWERAHLYSYTCINQSSPLTQQPHQLPYSGKFSRGENFRVFRGQSSQRENFLPRTGISHAKLVVCVVSWHWNANITTPKILLRLSSHSANISRYTVYIYRGVAARGITHGNGSLSETSRSGCLANLCPPPLSPPRVAVCLHSLDRLVGMTGALCRFS